MYDAYRLDLEQEGLRLLHTGDFANSTIICGEEKFMIHKVVACTFSEYFRAARKTLIFQMSADIRTIAVY